MKNNKLSKGQIIAIVLVAIVMIIAVVVGVVVLSKGDGLNPKPTEQETTVATTENSETEPEKETQKVTETQAQTETEKTTDVPKNNQTQKPNTNNENSTQTPNNSQNETNAKPDDIIDEIVLEDEYEEPKDNKTLVVNGVKCKVGDTITMVVNLKTPKKLCNFQGSTNYDTNFLKCTKTEINVNGMINDKGGAILYNGSDIGKGYNFTGYGTLYLAEFKVLKSGTTDITNDFEVLTGIDDKTIQPYECTTDLVIYT